jgi:hypothetical protein
MAHGRVLRNAKLVKFKKKILQHPATTMFLMHVVALSLTEIKNFKPVDD